jgi:hypothetical protein
VERLKKLLKEFSLKRDIVNSIIGLALVVSIILIFQNPNNPYAIMLACAAGGLMNIMNGLNMIKDPKKKMMGMSFIMMGIILATLGFIIIDLMKKA